VSADLLAPEFLRELEILKRRLEIDARSGAAGERVSRRRGSSAEFNEHRPYEPGDDLRRIDWAAYARSGQPVTKIFRAEEDAVVRIVLDASASLEFGTPSKLDVARRVAAAVGYLALGSGQRAELWVARTRPGEGAFERARPWAVSSWRTNALSAAIRALSSSSLSSSSTSASV